jgi:hypothetical protein
VETASKVFGLPSRTVGIAAANAARAETIVALVNILEDCVTTVWDDDCVNSV